MYCKIALGPITLEPNHPFVGFMFACKTDMLRMHAHHLFRYEKMAEQEEVNYQQLRRKLFAEVQQEKNRLADQFHQQKVSIDQKIDNMQQSNKRYEYYMMVMYSARACT